MTSALRQRCRNEQHCRTHLAELVDNHRRAFCCRGCWERFYHSRCVVCEKDISTSPITGERRKRLSQRRYCGRRCKSEAARFPHVFEWGGQSPQKGPANSRSADKTGLKNGPETHGQIGLGVRPSHRCLREWWWGGDPEGGDHSLYDKDGLTIARFVLDDGRYRLRLPVTRPTLSWVDLDEAKQRAVSMALAALPLDPSTAASTRKENARPHPMGAPLNLSSTVPFVDSPPIAPVEPFVGDPLEIPAFLKRG
jgi:hypothetical protein